MKRLKFTRQYDRMDCGPACVRMVASAFGKLYPLGWLRAQACLTREGVSVAGIRRALASAHLESASFKMTLEELEHQCPLPAILHWNQNHFVVLVRVWHRRERKWEIADPAFGRHWVDDQRMRSAWLAGGDKGVVVAAEPMPDFSEQRPPSESHSFLRFAKKHVWPFRRALVKSAAIMAGGILLSLVLPFLTQAMVDKGIGGANVNLILCILLAQLALTAGSFLMQFLGGRTALYMSTHISISIISGFLEKLLKLPMTFFDTKGAGDYQQRIADHTRLQNFMTLESLQTFFSIISVPFYLAIIGSYSLTALGAYLVLTAGAILWSAYFFRQRRAIDYEQFQLNVKVQNRMFEITNGIVDIKVNSMDRFKIEQWRSLQDKQYEMGRRVLRLDQLQNIGFAAISQLRNLAILCWIAVCVVDGSLTLGMMLSVSVIIGMVSSPLAQIVTFLRRLQDARISLERSDEVNTASNEDDPAMICVPLDYPLDIAIENVSFSYGGELEKPVLKNISFEIPAGSFIAIVGESGSGKTTLLKLLLKFYAPSSGRIMLGAEDLAAYSAASLRSTAGVVMQDNFLFSDTLAANVALGETASPERLEEALDTACLDDFVKTRPMGVLSMVGAEGNGLSGGERQRVMLARVAYKNPPYILLDEATSSLDAETEKRITDKFMTSFPGSTRIVIAHRLSTVCKADLIIVMRRGEVVETGTHDQLLKGDTYYKTLLGNQLSLAR